VRWLSDRDPEFGGLDEWTREFATRSEDERIEDEEKKETARVPREGTRQGGTTDDGRRDGGFEFPGILARERNSWIDRSFERGNSPCDSVLFEGRVRSARR
jgi:hypothetical protein